MRSQREVSPEELFLPDKHFSPSGNAVAAKQTAGWILDEDLLAKNPADKQ